MLQFDCVHRLYCTVSSGYHSSQDIYHTGNVEKSSCSQVDPGSTWHPGLPPFPVQHPVLPPTRFVEECKMTWCRSRSTFTRSCLRFPIRLAFFAVRWRANPLGAISLHQKVGNRRGECTAEMASLSTSERSDQIQNYGNYRCFVIGYF